MLDSWTDDDNDDARFRGAAAAGRLHYRLLSVVPTGKDCVKRLKLEPIPLHY